MKAIFEIELDESWNEYKDIAPELFTEDLFDNLNKEGVKRINLIKIED